MRHAQEKAHKELATSPQTHPAKMHHHDPTDCLPLRGDGPVGSSSVTYSLHMSKNPYRPSGPVSVFSLADIYSPLVIGGHGRSSFGILPRSPGGGGRDRTDDLMLAKHALSQLSYAPTGKDQENSGGPGKT